VQESYKSQANSFGADADANIPLSFAEAESLKE